MHEVVCDPGSLCLPVSPNAHGAMMNVISSEDHINCGMELNSGNLRSAKLLHVIDMMNVIVLDNGEYASHTSNDTRLLTVVDITASNNMRAYCLFGPAIILRTTDGISLHLCRTFHMPGKEIVVIILLRIIAKGNTAAFGSGDITVLDDPAF